MVFFAYLKERFPLAPYALLVASFYGAGAVFAHRVCRGTPTWWLAPVILLVFFHLRVFDEHKDFDKDKLSHPERLLSRGVVTLRMLKVWGAIAIGGEVVLAALGGRDVFLWWSAVFLFTVAMRFEFGVGRWLNQHILAYAITHNPVVALLAAFTWASTHGRWDDRFNWFIWLASTTSLAFEIARKTRLPTEEVPGVDSYSSVHGREKAGTMVYALVAVSGVLTVGALTSFTRDWRYALPALAGVLLGRYLTRAGMAQKKVELAASLAMLLDFGSLWAGAAFA